MSPIEETNYNIFVKMGKNEYGSEDTKWDHLFHIETCKSLSTIILLTSCQ